MISSARNESRSARIATAGNADIAATRTILMIERCIDASMVINEPNYVESSIDRRPGNNGGIEVRAVKLSAEYWE